MTREDDVAMAKVRALNSANCLMVGLAAMLLAPLAFCFGVFTFGEDVWLVGGVIVVVMTIVWVVRHQLRRWGD